MLLGDSKVGQNPQDPLKTTFVPKQHKRNISEKAMTKNFHNCVRTGGAS